MIYFGGIDGFIAFNPKSFSENKNLPTVVITDFLLFNKEVYADEPNSPLEKNITFSDKIVLRADQNSFSFRISTTLVMYLNNYLKTSKNYGMSGAISVVIFVITGLLSLVVFKSLTKQEEN